MNWFQLRNFNLIKEIWRIYIEVAVCQFINKYLFLVFKCVVVSKCYNYDNVDDDITKIMTDFVTSPLADDSIACCLTFSLLWLLHHYVERLFHRLYTFFYRCDIIIFWLHALRIEQSIGFLILHHSFDNFNGKFLTHIYRHIIFSSSCSIITCFCLFDYQTLTSLPSSVVPTFFYHRHCHHLHCPVCLRHHCHCKVTIFFNHVHREPFDFFNHRLWTDCFVIEDIVRWGILTAWSSTSSLKSSNNCFITHVTDTIINKNSALHYYHRQPLHHYLHHHRHHHCTHHDHHRLQHCLRHQHRHSWPSPGC